MPDERGLHTILSIPSVGAIADRSTAPAIPDDEGLRVPCRREVLLREQLLGIRPHQEGAVRPLADEACIVEPLLQQDVDHAQGEGAVSAGPDLEPAGPLSRPGSSCAGR